MAYGANRVCGACGYVSGTQSTMQRWSRRYKIRELQRSTMYGGFRTIFVFSLSVCFSLLLPQCVHKLSVNPYSDKCCNNCWAHPV